MNDTLKFVLGVAGGVVVGSAAFVVADIDVLSDWMNKKIKSWMGNN